MKTMIGSVAMLCVAMMSSVLAEDTPRLHPLESACVEYALTGQMMNGTVSRCHRKYGYESFDIQDGTMTFGGFTQPQKQNTIVIGDTIYSIDLEKLTGTRTTNPMYEKMVSQLAGKSPEEMKDTFMTSMGFVATGESKTIAGHDCGVFSSSMMGTMCMSDDGLMLEQTVMGNTRTATSVSIGESGADENYDQYTRVSITEGPSMPQGYRQ